MSANAIPWHDAGGLEYAVINKLLKFTGWPHKPGDEIWQQGFEMLYAIPGSGAGGPNGDNTDPQSIVGAPAFEASDTPIPGQQKAYASWGFDHGVIMQNTPPNWVWGAGYIGIGLSQQDQNFGARVGLVPGGLDMTGDPAVFWSDGNNVPDTMLERAGVGRLKSTGGLGMFGVAPPAAKPATPADQAGIIALLQSYGMCA